MSGFQPFQLDSFEQEARRLVEAARARAREILQAALAERERVREEARRQGFEAGRAEGQKAAAETERKRIAADTAGLQDLLRGIAGAIEGKRVELMTLAERDLVRLSLAIARKVVKREIESEKRIAAGNLRRAVELVARRHELHILLNPADADAVQDYLPALHRDFADIGNLKIDKSDSVARGGCVVAIREGSVDADVETQLREIERGLLG